MSQSLRFISAEDALKLFNYPDLIQALKQAHQQTAAQHADLLLNDQASGNNTFFLRAAWQSEQALGAKLITVFPHNPQQTHALPAVQAVYLLFDAQTGSPLACMDATVLTWFKTAADSALAASLLAPRHCEQLLMVGAGAMAGHLIRAHLSVRPGIQTLRIWNRTPARAEQLLRTLDLPIASDVVTDLDAAVASSDLISCATMSHTPLIKGALLSAGTHLDLVGGFTPDMREADDEAIRRSQVFVDSYSSALEHVGDICQPINSGLLDPARIGGDLYELCSRRKPGRRDDQDITLFKNAGGGHLDLMTAQHLLHLSEQSLLTNA